MGVQCRKSSKKSGMTGTLAPKFRDECHRCAPVRAINRGSKPAGGAFLFGNLFAGGSGKSVPDEQGGHAPRQRKRHQEHRLPQPVFRRQAAGDRRLDVAARINESIHDVRVRRRGFATMLPPVLRLHC